MKRWFRGLTKEEKLGIAIGLGTLAVVALVGMLCSSLEKTKFSKSPTWSGPYPVEILRVEFGRSPLSGRPLVRGIVWNKSTGTLQWVEYKAYFLDSRGRVLAEYPAMDFLLRPGERRRFELVYPGPFGDRWKVVNAVVELKDWSF